MSSGPFVALCLLTLHQLNPDVFHTCFAATEYHLGLLKAKLAKYRAQLLEPSKSAGAKGEGFDVMKSGDARVALIGFPSVGKVTMTPTVPCCIYDGQDML